MGRVLSNGNTYLNSYWLWVASIARSEHEEDDLENLSGSWEKDGGLGSDAARAYHVISKNI